MKGYLVVTGTIFGLVGIAHLVRLFLVCSGLAVWAARLFVAPRGRSA